MMKIILGIIGGIGAALVYLFVKLNFENYKSRKYQEEKDLRRRGIDPKNRKL